MISEPPLSTTAALGTNATFSCHGTGTVMWQINGTQVHDASQVSFFENLQVFVPLPRPSSSELIITATEVTNATLFIICVVDPGLVKSDAVRLLVYGRYLCCANIYIHLSLVDRYSNIIWRASPFARGRKGMVSCLYAICSYCCSQECSPIRSLHVTTNIAWLLVCRPTNQRPALLVQ